MFSAQTLDPSMGNTVSSIPTSAWPRFRPQYQLQNKASDQVWRKTRTLGPTTPDAALVPLREVSGLTRPKWVSCFSGRAKIGEEEEDVVFLLVVLCTNPKKGALKKDRPE